MISYIRKRLIKGLYKFVLWLLSGSVKRNVRYKDMHKGEDVYIVGNGASLKYYDLSVLRDKKVITCGSMFAHKDFNNLSCEYYMVSHPGLFFPIWKHPYTHRITKNIVGLYYKRKMKEYRSNNIVYFTPLINKLSFMPYDMNFLYTDSDSDLSFDASRNFNFNKGSFAYMLGLAAYMGAKNIYILGVDYAVQPKIHGHFYEKGETLVFKKNNWSCDYIDRIKSVASMCLVVPSDDFNSGCDIKSVTYEEHFDKKAEKKSHTSIVSKADIDEMSRWQFPLNL